MQAQLDLFTDSRDVMLRNDLIDALMARNASAARRALERWVEGGTADAANPAACRLVAALATPAAPPFADASSAAAAASAVEEALVPAAVQVLGATAAAVWLRPCWRDLARRAAPLPFDAAQATTHAAVMWLRAAEWTAATAAVATIESWRRMPLPLAWMAQARWHLLGADACWPLFAELAWMAPRHLPGLLQALPDPLLHRLMQRFEAEFDSQTDTAEQPEAWAWLPAWALTHEPLMAQPLSGAAASADTPAHHAFTLMQSLLRLERQGRHRDIVDARQRLRGTSPALFAAYMRVR